MHRFGTDLSFWRGGQLQHHPSMWLQSAAELKRSAQLLDLQTTAGDSDYNRHSNSAKEQLETEWEMCRREYDARIALMMLTEGRQNNHIPKSTGNSPTRSTVESSKPLMKLLDGGGETGNSYQQARRSFFSEKTDLKFPQELKEDRLGSRQFLGSASRPRDNLFDRFPSTEMDEREHVFFFRNSSPEPLVNSKPEYSRCEDNILSLSPPHSWRISHPGTPNLSSSRRTTAEPHVHFVDYLTPRQQDHHHMGGGTGGGHVQLDLTMSTGSGEFEEAGQLHQYWAESLDDPKRRNNVVPELDLSLELALSGR